MTHPLEAEPGQGESLDSSQLLQGGKEVGGEPQKLVPNTGSSEWSDMEEWKSNWDNFKKKTRLNGELNTVLIIIEIFLVILTLISPVLIYAVPILWARYQFGVSDSTQGCRVLCEVRLLSLCVKYAILCSVIIMLYAVRLRTTISCAGRVHTSSSSWFRSTKHSTELSKSKTALSLSESERQNFPVFILLDLLMALVNFVFWIYLISKWNFQVTHLMRPGKQKISTLKNPFIQTNRNRELENVAANFALSDCKDFINVHLFIQIAGALFIKAWEIACGEKWFLIHVVRAPDSFSHAYRMGLVDVHSAAVQVIQNLSIQPRVS